MARRKSVKMFNPFKPKKRKANPIGKMLKTLSKGMKEVEKRPFGPMGWW